MKYTNARKARNPEAQQVNPNTDPTLYSLIPVYLALALAIVLRALPFLNHSICGAL